MRIDGKQIAAQILEQITAQITHLKEKNITPHLVIMLIGEDPASKAYVHQKELKAKAIGARITILRFPQTITEKEVLITIEQWNNDDTVHGIILQRPLPPHIDLEKINQLTNPLKDIDAFHKDSPFTMPLAGAVLKVLEYIFHDQHIQVKKHGNKQFLNWLISQHIVIIGKGQTGGGPTISLLKTLGVKPLIIDSKTTRPEKLTQKADIIITTVGKSHMVKSEQIKKGAILIGVGMYKGTDGKLHGDYEEEEIKDIASYYTPIPGGVGPINVAMLLQNLVRASRFNLTHL